MGLKDADADPPLPVVDAPYLPPADDPSIYTLVLDLDETLVHYSEVHSRD